MTHPNLAAIETALAATRSPVIADFLRCMQGIHPPERLPARAAFDPMMLPRILDHLVLVELHRTQGEVRFFLRVAGELVLRAAPVPLMNRYLETSVDLDKSRPDDSQARILDPRRRVAESGVTVHWRGRVNIPFRFNFADVEFAHCPLAEDGATVDRILSAFEYHLDD